jgi:hypothetical protein
MKDYYKILGISYDATQEEIKSAYRRLAKKYHPDVSQGDVEKIKEINEAYRILSDSKLRSEYDSRMGFRSRYYEEDANFSRKSYTEEDNLYKRYASNYEKETFNSTLINSDKYVFKDLASLLDLILYTLGVAITTSIMLGILITIFWGIFDFILELLGTDLKFITELLGIDLKFINPVFYILFEAEGAQFFLAFTNIYAIIFSLYFVIYQDIFYVSKRGFILTTTILTIINLIAINQDENLILKSNMSIFLIYLLVIGPILIGLFFILYSERKKEKDTQKKENK